MTTKRPWMPLYIDDYLGATAHLEAHEHGAYLLLMMHYWSKGSLPTDDEIIRKISRLSIRQWRRARPLLQSFFGDDWKHERIDKELAKAIEKSKANSANAAKSHEVRKASVTKLEVVRKESAADPQHTLHTSHKNSLSTASDAVEEVKRSAEVGTPIDPNFWPCGNHLVVCKIDGATDEIIKAEVAAFIHARQERGSFSIDWDASWGLWWKRWKEHRDKQAAKEKPKAPPRVEVDKKIDWDGFCKRYAGGMGWPKGIGPDPESLACQCPPDILQKHGFRPVASEVAS